MRKLLGVFSITSFCLVLSFGATGCFGSKEKEKFETKAQKAELAGKEKKTTIGFGKEVEKVEPVKKDGVETTHKGKDVTFTQTVDAPAKDTEIEFEVTGKGKDEKCKVTITLKAPKKESGSGDKEDKVFAADKDKGTLEAKDGTVVVTFKHGEIKSVTPDDDKLVSATPDGKKVTFKQIGDSPAKEKVIEFTVKPKKGEDVTIKITVAAAAAAKEEMKDKDLKVKGTAPEKLPTFSATKDEDNVVTIKFSEGKVKAVKVTPDDKGVSAKGEADWVKITVTKDYKTTDDIKIEVEAVGGKKGIEIEIKAGKLKVSLLNDRNDQRMPNSLRQFAAISSERFVAMIRRM